MVVSYGLRCLDRPHDLADEPVVRRLGVRLHEDVVAPFGGVDLGLERLHRIDRYVLDLVDHRRDAGEVPVIFLVVVGRLVQRLMPLEFNAGVTQAARSVWACENAACVGTGRTAARAAIVRKLRRVVIAAPPVRSQEVGRSG